ncbi:Crp/Fnr family transcriptional regulator [Nitriliruptor alkaliphilus]|uniref:Crp/Fnr family transcriptional regulator n=1 Tax=Nitriliruptor alkaliphilus TaxID=427918 RepID=UPI000696CC87|nr:Crp/Fnr family transcriptional regulator [Nitriliruptor alkaliphilus]
MGTPGAAHRRRAPRRGGPGVAHGTTRSSLLLGALPPDDLVTLIEGSHGLTGRRGDRLAARTDDAVTVILHGVAAARTSTIDGEHTIHSLRGPGDVHGLTVALGHPEAGDELVAVDQVDALVLPGGHVRDLVALLPSVTRAAVAVIANELAALRVEEARFASRSASYRIEHRLLELADRFGERDGARILVTLALTQEELASWARTSRESAAKALHDLRVAGIVTTGRRELIVEDLPALRRRHDGGPDRTVAALMRAIG